MAYDSAKDTQEHIKRVQYYIGIIFLELAKRNEGHDASKLEDPEKAIFDIVTPKLKGLTYGSDESELLTAKEYGDKQ